MLEGGVPEGVALEREPRSVIGGRQVLADSMFRRYHVAGAPSALLHNVRRRDAFALYGGA